MVVADPQLGENSRHFCWACGRVEHLLDGTDRSRRGGGRLPDHRSRGGLRVAGGHNGVH